MAVKHTFKSTPAKFHPLLAIDNIQITQRLSTLNSKLKSSNLLTDTKFMVGLKVMVALGSMLLSISILCKKQVSKTERKFFCCEDILSEKEKRKILSPASN